MFQKHILSKPKRGPQAVIRGGMASWPLRNDGTGLGVSPPPGSPQMDLPKNQLFKQLKLGHLFLLISVNM